MPRSLSPVVALIGSLVAMSLGPAGCTYVYQPMEGLHRPVVTDPTVRNFEALQLTVHCVPGEHLNPSEHRRLCSRIGDLFENQGAGVEVVDTVELSPSYFGGPDDLAPGADTATVEEPTPDADLILEVRPSRIGKGNSNLSWALCIASLSLVPAVDEETFAIDLEVRDGTGFLLLQDSLKGRTIRRFGSVSYVGNRFMDWASRDKKSRHRPDAAERELSKDLYGQLTQLVFNARMRSIVQQDAQASRGRP